jgi:hypothetical protein
LTVGGERLGSNQSEKGDDASVEALATQEEGSGRVRLLVFSHDTKLVSDEEIEREPQSRSVRITLRGLGAKRYEGRLFTIGTAHGLGDTVRWDPVRKATTPFQATRLTAQSTTEGGELVLRVAGTSLLEIPRHSVLFFELTPARESSSPPAPLHFTDVTRAVGLERTSVTYEAAAADYDKDGFPDLMISNHEKVPSLFHNEADGHFRDVTPIGKFTAADVHGLTWSDIDADGWIDLLMSIGAGRGQGEGPKRLYMNRGGRKLEQVEPDPVIRDPAGRGRSICPIDLDGDGAIDYLMMNHLQEGRPQRVAVRRGDHFENWAEGMEWANVAAGCVTPVHIDDSPEPVFFTSTEGPQQGHAYRRDAGGRMKDVSSELGGFPKNGVNAVVPGDYDNDGDLDLYLVRGPYLQDGADVAQNTLWLYFNPNPGVQKSARFRTTGALTIDLQIEGAPNRELVHLGKERTVLPVHPWHGRADDPLLKGKPELDLKRDRGAYLWAEDGGTLTFAYLGEGGKCGELGGSIKSDAPMELIDRSGLQVREDLRSILLENQNGRFVDVTDRAGVGVVRTGMDGAFADLDNDGDLDLFVVNGGLAFPNPPDILFRNNGDRTFTDVAAEAGVIGPTEGRGASVLAFDYDRDGDLDLFTTNGRGPAPRNEGPYCLLQNDGATGHWLEVEVLATVSNRDCMGTRVTARLGDHVQRQERCGGNSTYATSVLPFHFGLGDATQATLEIVWPSGRTLTITAPADDTIRVAEPGPPPEKR